MKVVFTKHGGRKLGQRRIPRNLVIATLSSPDFVRPSYGNRQVAYKKIRKNHLAVVFVREKDSHLVITQHWVAKVLRKR